MIEESFFSVPAAVTLIVQDNVVVELVVDSPVPTTVTHIVGSSMTETNEEDEPIANHENEQQQPPIQDVPHNEPPRKSRRDGRSAISEDYDVYFSKKIKWRVIPALLKKPLEMSIHPNGLRLWKIK
jgi:hypothetical protein